MAKKRNPRGSTQDSTADDILVQPANEIDPYAILSLETSATQEQIKSAYRKAALKHHPDKVPIEEKDEANRKFQEIATAYAILSDERRRQRYDTTGNTSESLDDEDFNWTEFFKEQSAAMVNGDVIEQIKREYQGSEEERSDVLKAFEEGEGDMDAIYENIMCSNVLDDDERFRKYIDEGIEHGLVKQYSQYATESKTKKRKRLRKAEEEAKEAMDLAEELGVKEKLYGSRNGKTKSSKTTHDSDDALKALIRRRQKDRCDIFFDQLEAKYGGMKKGKRKVRDEPPEEMFQKNSKQAKPR